MNWFIIDSLIRSPTQKSNKGYTFNKNNQPGDKKIKTIKTSLKKAVSIVPYTTVNNFTSLYFQRVNQNKFIKIKVHYTTCL